MYQVRDGPLENLWGRWEDEAQEKNSCKGNCAKKFHA